MSNSVLQQNIWFWIFEDWETFTKSLGYKISNDIGIANPQTNLEFQFLVGVASL